MGRALKGRMVHETGTNRVTGHVSEFDALNGFEGVNESVFFEFLEIYLFSLPVEQLQPNSQL